MNTIRQHVELTAIPLGLIGKLPLCPTVITEDELIRFLRIPEISSAKNHRHVVEHFKRAHGLPRIHLCRKTVYLTDVVKVWLESHITHGQ